MLSRDNLASFFKTFFACLEFRRIFMLGTLIPSDFLRRMNLRMKGIIYGARGSFAASKGGGDFTVNVNMNSCTMELDYILGPTVGLVVQTDDFADHAAINAIGVEVILDCLESREVLFVCLSAKGHSSQGLASGYSRSDRCASWPASARRACSWSSARGR